MVTLFTWTAVLSQSKQETVQCDKQKVDIRLILQDAHCFGLLKKPLGSLLLISCISRLAICLGGLNNSSVSMAWLSLGQ